MGLLTGGQPYVGQPLDLGHMAFQAALSDLVVGLACAAAHKSHNNRHRSHQYSRVVRGPMVVAKVVELHSQRRHLGVLHRAGVVAGAPCLQVARRLRHRGVAQYGCLNPQWRPNFVRMAAVVACDPWPLVAGYLWFPSQEERQEDLAAY